MTKYSDKDENSQKKYRLKKDKRNKDTFNTDGKGFKRKKLTKDFNKKEFSFSKTNELKFNDKHTDESVELSNKEKFAKENYLGSSLNIKRKSYLDLSSDSSKQDKSKESTEITKKDYEISKGKLDKDNNNQINKSKNNLNKNLNKNLENSNLDENGGFFNIKANNDKKNNYILNKYIGLDKDTKKISLNDKLKNKIAKYPFSLTNKPQEGSKKLEVGKDEKVSVEEGSKKLEVGKDEKVSVEEGSKKLEVGKDEKVSVEEGSKKLEVGKDEKVSVEEGSKKLEVGKDEKVSVEEGSKKLEVGKDEKVSVEEGSKKLEVGKDESKYASVDSVAKDDQPGKSGIDLNDVQDIQNAEDATTKSISKKSSSSAAKNKRVRPVGKLAWSLDDEPDSNTEINLNLDFLSATDNKLSHHKQKITPSTTGDLNKEFAYLGDMVVKSANVSDEYKKKNLFFIFKKLSRYLWAPIVAIFIFMGGLMFGYSYISDDGDVLGVFNWDTWEHAYKFIFGG